jgi:hypothetical protein
LTPFRRILLLAVVALVVGGCGGDEAATTLPATATATATPTQTAQSAQTAQPKVAGKDCSQVGDLAAEPKRQLPADIGVLSYAHLYRSEAGSGKSQRFYAVLDGTPDELASRRDDAQNELVQNWGFASLRSDDKPGVEAKAHLEGAKHTVDVQVTPLCQGKLRIRYTVR